MFVQNLFRIFPKYSDYIQQKCPTVLVYLELCQVMVSPMSIEIDGKKYYWTLEVCRKAPLSRSTLLRWLKRGLIEEPIRDRRGWRIFSEEALMRIKSEIKRISECQLSK